MNLFRSIKDYLMRNYEPVFHNQRMLVVAGQTHETLDAAHILNQLPMTQTRPPNSGIYTELYLFQGVPPRQNSAMLNDSSSD